MTPPRQTECFLPATDDDEDDGQETKRFKLRLAKKHENEWSRDCEYYVSSLGSDPGMSIVCLTLSATMLRSSWKPVAATVATGLPAYYFYSTWTSRATFDLPIRVRQADGKVGMAHKTLPLLSLDEVNSRLNERATSESILRPNGIRWNYANAALPSNDPIEDAHAKQIIQRDASDPSAPGDYAFFAVMDGHGGFETSSLLSQILINAVVLELGSAKASSPSALKRVTSLFTSASAPADPKHVAETIQLAFTNLDRELVNAPLRIFASSIDEKTRQSKTIPDLSEHPLAMKTMQPAIAGKLSLVYPNSSLKHLR